MENFDFVAKKDQTLKKSMEYTRIDKNEVMY